MKRKGTRRERDLVEALSEDGWVTFRTPGSLGPADVIALRAGNRPMLVQVKAGKAASWWGRFPPHERTALANTARKAGADAYACFWRDGEKSPLMISEADWPPPSKRGTPDYLVDENGCWIWQKHLAVEGYGICHRRGKTWLAHRFYYEEHVGPIPAGLQLDHLCRVRPCVNPEHLEAVTGQVNIWRTSITKLSPGQVQAIRASTGSPQRVAEKYGITRGHVWRIRTGRKRADVPHQPPSPSKSPKDEQ